MSNIFPASGANEPPASGINFHRALLREWGAWQQPYDALPMSVFFTEDHVLLCRLVDVVPAVMNPRGAIARSVSRTAAVMRVLSLVSAGNVYLVDEAAEEYCVLVDDNMVWRRRLDSGVERLRRHGFDWQDGRWINVHDDTIGRRMPVPSHIACFQPEELEQRGVGFMAEGRALDTSGGFLVQEIEEIAAVPARAGKSGVEGLVELLRLQLVELGVPFSDVREVPVEHLALPMHLALTLRAQSPAPETHEAASSLESETAVTAVTPALSHEQDARLALPVLPATDSQTVKRQALPDWSFDELQTLVDAVGEDIRTNSKRNMPNRILARWPALFPSRPVPDRSRISQLIKAAKKQGIFDSKQPSPLPKPAFPSYRSAPKNRL